MAATDTAWTKIIDEIKAVLANARPDVHWFTTTERGDMEPLSEALTPGVIIGMARVDFAYSEMVGQMRHRGQIIFSCQSGILTGLSIDAVNQDIIASIVSALAASELLGGRVEFMDPDRADATEQAAPDIGEALLTYACQFYTPTDDFRTLVGAGGATF